MLFSEHGPLSERGYIWAIYPSPQTPQDEPMAVFDRADNASAFARVVGGLIGRLDNAAATRVPPLPR